MKSLRLLGMLALIGLSFASCKKEVVEPIDDYKVYTGLISQTNENTPTVQLIKNTIGNIQWSYSIDGEYIGTLENGFPYGKTFVYIESGNVTGGGGYFISIKRIDQSHIAVYSSYSDFLGANNAITNRSIEIRVYE